MQNGGSVCLQLTHISVSYIFHTITISAQSIFVGEHR